LEKSSDTTTKGYQMTLATATPVKLVGKALYLELTADSTKPEEEVKSLIGWNASGTKQILIFPQYQDDMGKTFPAVLLSRIISANTPRSQWDRSRLHSNPKPIDLTPTEDESGYHADYKDIETYKSDEWAELPEVAKEASRKLALELYLRNEMLGTRYETVAEGERVAVVGQGWVVRDSKPIAVEITNADMSELHDDYKTPQAVIRRINKVRETISTFPAKLV
jgi:hypothetical protein